MNCPKPLEPIGIAIEDLAFSIEEWSTEGDHLAEVLARVSAFAIALPAYQAACAFRPNARMRLRQGARIIRDSGGAA